MVRNEDWIIGFSLRAALRWVDHMVVLDHASTDQTPQILRAISDENPGRITVLREENPVWNEMSYRQRTLEEGRSLGGTHFAIIDADEVLTSNLWKNIREWSSALIPGQVLELPMIATWRSIDRYRDDQSIWSRSFIGTVFRDDGKLRWKSAEDGYEHHKRIPYGARGDVFTPIREKRMGGVMHLQFINWRRLRAKHYWYRMMESVRWPGRQTPEELNRIYGQALDESGMKLSLVHPSWLIGVSDLLSEIKTGSASWHEEEIRRLWKEYGPGPFIGLEIPNDLLGDPSRPPKGYLDIPSARIPDTQKRSFGIWFCQSCGVIASIMKTSDRFSMEKIALAHSTYSKGCPGNELKVVDPEEILKEGILGKVPKKELPLVVSYYTNDVYKKAANGLESSLRLLRLDYEIHEVPWIKTWKEGVLYKPSFLKKMLEEHPGRDIVWIDADAYVRAYPDLIIRENPEFDVAFYHAASGYKEVYGGTIFLKNSPKILSLVGDWILECRKDPESLDEVNLGRAVQKRKDLVFKLLPAGYCWVERWMRGQKPLEEVVIEHFAISRPDQGSPFRLVTTLQPLDGY